jgi:hypothetical protein
MIKSISAQELANCGAQTTIINVGRHAGGAEVCGSIRYRPSDLLEVHHLLLPIRRESDVILYTEHGDADTLWRIAAKMSFDGFADVRIYLGTLDEFKRAGGRTQNASYEQIVPPSEPAEIADVDRRI